MADAPRKRRWPWFLAAFVVLAGLAAIWVDRQLEPNRLTATVLARAGAAMGLEFTIDGTPEYALRPEPRLVLPRLKVRQPGAAAPWILRAERAEVSLPWDTLTGGGSLVITRLELVRPELDVGALTTWLDSRPASTEPFELPTFTDGLAIEGGRVSGAGWEIDALSLSLPTLVPGAPAQAELSGVFTQEGTKLTLLGQLVLDRAGLASGVRLDAGGQLRSGELQAPWSLAMAGELGAFGVPVSLRVDSLQWRSQPPLPDFSAAGRVDYGDSLRLDLKGELPRWPEGWPVLPEPMASSASPFAFSLAYQGAPDLAAPLSLQLRRDETVLDTRLVLSDMLAWLDADASSPLPPLTGELQTPSVVVGGATLEGLRITLEPEPADGTPVGGTSVPIPAEIGTEAPPTGEDTDE